MLKIRKWLAVIAVAGIAALAVLAVPSSDSASAGPVVHKQTSAHHKQAGKPKHHKPKGKHHKGKKGKRKGGVLFAPCQLEKGKSVGVEFKQRFNDSLSKKHPFWVRTSECFTARAKGKGKGGTVKRYDRLVGRQIVFTREITTRKDAVQIFPSGQKPFILKPHKTKRWSKRSEIAIKRFTIWRPVEHHNPTKPHHKPTKPHHKPAPKKFKKYLGKDCNLSNHPNAMLFRASANSVHNGKTGVISFCWTGGGGARFNVCNDHTGAQFGFFPGDCTGNDALHFTSAIIWIRKIQTNNIRVCVQGWHNNNFLVNNNKLYAPSNPISAKSLELYQPGDHIPAGCPVDTKSTARNPKAPGSNPFAPGKPVHPSPPGQGGPGGQR